MVTVHSDGTQSNKGGSFPVMSGDGRYITFESTSSNLEDTELSNLHKVFLHDTETSSTILVSKHSDGTPPDDGGPPYSIQGSRHPDISSDGRYITFWSDTTDLVDGDTNGHADVFVNDTQTGITELVSVSSDGTQGDGHSSTVSISSDGRYISFGSAASTLVTGDNNNVGDLFRVANPLYEPTTTETTTIGITLQIGANNSDNDKLSFNISATTADNLSLTATNLSNLEDAQSAINSLDTAIDFLNDHRSNLGAVTNRLEFAHSNVYSGIQNTEASLSTIRDADFAEEAANLAKSQILTQAGSAMLAQANNLSQNILSLIR